MTTARVACRGFAGSLLLGCVASCGTLVEYSDALVNEATGRSNFVTTPASVLGVVGFIGGIPLDLAALPVTYLLYASQKEGEEEGLDPLSTLLFPSFILWRTGVLAVGAPLDLIEFTVYRAWKSPEPKTRVDYGRELERAWPDETGEELERRGLERTDPGVEREDPARPASRGSRQPRRSP